MLLVREWDGVVLWGACRDTRYSEVLVAADIGVWREYNLASGFNKLYELAAICSSKTIHCTTNHVRGRMGSFSKVEKIKSGSYVSDLMSQITLEIYFRGKRELVHISIPLFTRYLYVIQ